MGHPSRRHFLEQLLAAAAAAGPLASGLAAAPGYRRRPRPSGDPIRIGVIGVRGRGRAHIGAFKKSPDAEVVAICDADEGVIGPARKSVPEARYYKDLRALLDDPEVDAVSIATPNHWHSLAAIWALQAGKHVYVEKPMSHNVFEGRQLVAMAARSGLVVQVGTQARTQPATRDALQWLREGGLGEVHLAHGLCYKRRQSIGKVDGPQDPPPTCDYDLWTGPAPLKPLMRQNLHYDWHWVFDTGNGDIGNQGVHQMDIARWGLGLDRHPVRVQSCGGRLGYVDDGETPNSQLALLDYGDRQVLFEVRGLETGPFRGAHIGVVFFGEGGYLVSASYNKVVAFDPDGQEMKVFTGSGDHFQVFLDAVKAGDPGAVDAPPIDGHLSAAMGHLANISWLLGEERRLAGETAPFGDLADANEAWDGMRKHLAANGVDAAAAKVHAGPLLHFDGRAEHFTGVEAARANPLLARDYREPYVVPGIAE